MLFPPGNHLIECGIYIRNCYGRVGYKRFLRFSGIHIEAEQKEISMVGNAFPDYAHWGIIRNV